jgi:hypothetical protein
MTECAAGHCSGFCFIAWAAQQHRVLHVRSHLHKPTPAAVAAAAAAAELVQYGPGSQIERVLITQAAALEADAPGRAALPFYVPFPGLPGEMVPTLHAIALCGERIIVSHFRTCATAPADPAPTAAAMQVGTARGNACNASSTGAQAGSRRMFDSQLR